MHLLARETRMLDEIGAAADLGQSPADVVFLSFSDSDLGAAAAAWQSMGAERPGLRLANLARLAHPMSVDLYAGQVIAHARCVVIRLLGGIESWRYGVEEVADTCRRTGAKLILLPGDARVDARFRELSLVPPDAYARVNTYFTEGGAENLARALRLAAHLAGLCVDDAGPPVALPRHGIHRASDCTTADQRAVIVFYRAHLVAADTAPFEALVEALRERGFVVGALYVGSLKNAEDARFVAQRLTEWRPSVVLNATGFSARLSDEDGSPLDAAGAPVLQLIQSGSAREAWQESARGLSQTDLAMQVVLPELDGRLSTTAISFKAEAEEIPGLEFSRVVHRPDEAGIALAADRALGWARLAAAPRGNRHIAIVLSDYPGAPGQIAHAVGLDAIASTAEIIRLLRDAGYACEPDADAEAITAALCRVPPTSFMDIAAYRQHFAALPKELQEQVIASWGAPEDDPSAQASCFALRFAWYGNVLLAVQPDRGNGLDRKSSYHNPDLPPRHAYIAFYLWLRDALNIHALVHLGTHGTLEWLPGKATAPSASCWPAALLGGVPAIYPFIVNNPGEAAVAKRRLGAVMIGHLTPPLSSVRLSGAAAELERLIEEYAAADGLDRRRTALLRTQILAKADSAGLLQESGATQEMSADDALARLDAYLCDVKDMQIRDGLHVFGRDPAPAARLSLLEALRRTSPNIADDLLAERLDASAAAERKALLAALDGRFVPPGPAGAPTRGRADVLPTGRNIYAVDPRAIPTPSAMELARKAADDLLRRHMQEQGDWPRALVMDLWGSTTMRTGGEDFALALVLMGAQPVWDAASGRLTGVEILPLAVLDRPRVDVTLRISGLFRDAFQPQIVLFDTAVQAIAARDESPEWNTLAGSVRNLDATARRQATLRVFGPAPGLYGTGLADILARGAWQDCAVLGDAWLTGSASAYGVGLEGAPAVEALQAQVAQADAFVHQQDHREIDLLDSTEYAQHEAGFAAAAAKLGGKPALYHADTSTPDTPRTRTLAEEIARVVRGRAANPDWIAGMMRHGYRGAAEIAGALDGLFAFAAMLPQRLDRQFELMFDATLGNDAVDAFLRNANPDARAAMAARYADAMQRDLWRPRRNDIGPILQEMRP